MSHSDSSDDEYDSYWDTNETESLEDAYKANEIYFARMGGFTLASKSTTEEPEEHLPIQDTPELSARTPPNRNRMKTHSCARATPIIQLIHEIKIAKEESAEIDAQFTRPEIPDFRSRELWSFFGYNADKPDKNKKYDNSFNFSRIPCHNSFAALGLQQSSELSFILKLLNGSRSCEWRPGQFCEVQRLMKKIYAEIDVLKLLEVTIVGKQFKPEQSKGKRTNSEEHVKVPHLNKSNPRKRPKLSDIRFF